MSNRVMVFAPGVRLTITVEPHAGEVDLHVHAGGQGVWQARMLATLGARAVLCTTLGGEPGRVLGSLFEDEPFLVRPVPQSAVSGWYVHDRRQGARAEVAEHPGRALDRHAIDELYTLALSEGLAADVAVFAGPTHPALLAPDVYRRLAADLRSHGVPVVADMVGDHLRAALASGVAFVKVSHNELVETGWAADDSVPTLVRVAHQLQEGGADSVVISRAELPALALLGEEMSWVELPALQIADSRGAGDSMTAGIAASLAQGGDLIGAVRTGAAAGALNVTRHGLGTGQADAVKELARRVRLTPVTMEVA